VSSQEESLEEEEERDKSEMAAVVPSSEQVEDTVELMLEGTSLSCEDATSSSVVLSVVLWQGVTAWM
jgi:hypothetical protein